MLSWQDELYGEWHLSFYVRCSARHILSVVPYRESTLSWLSVYRVCALCGAAFGSPCKRLQIVPSSQSLLRIADGLPVVACAPAGSFPSGWRRNGSRQMRSWLLCTALFCPSYIFVRNTSQSRRFSPTLKNLLRQTTFKLSQNFIEWKERIRKNCGDIQGVFGQSTGRKGEVQRQAVSTA